MNQKRIIEIIKNFLNQKSECTLYVIAILTSPNSFNSDDACVQKHHISNDFRKTFPQIEFIQKDENNVQIKKMLFADDSNNLSETKNYNELSESDIEDYLLTFLKDYIEIQKQNITNTSS